MAARRLKAAGKTPPKKTALAKAAPADDLDVLAPERQAPIAGEAIVVREYGFFEGARLLPLAQPLLADLQAIFGAGGAPMAGAVIDVLIAHADLVRHLVARAIVQPGDGAAATEAAIAEREKWLETLNDVDGEVMLLLWWQANSGFFIRRLLREAVLEKASPSAGAGSSTP